MTRKCTRCARTQMAARAATKCRYCGGPLALRMPHGSEIVEAVDGAFMVLVGGFQWGPAGVPRDRSGAASSTWPTQEAAAAAFREAVA